MAPFSVGQLEGASDSELPVIQSAKFSYARKVGSVTY